MIFYLHYIMLTGGLCGTSVLLGVYLKQYSDASQGEIGALLMTFPFVAIFIKPLFCSLADRYQAHKAYLIGSLAVLVIGYLPFVIIPCFPEFYEKMPRASWYLLVIACHIGNAGLGVAWSLGDSLAVNCAQRTSTPYGRMRLTGTISWGVFGYVIGEINEYPQLPKFLPAFLVLITNALIEIVLLTLWDNKDFEMCDPIQPKATAAAALVAGNEQGLAATGAANATNKHQLQLQQQQQVAEKTDPTKGTGEKGDPVITLPHLAKLPCCQPAQAAQSDFVDSTPSSLGGTLRMNSNTAMAMKSVIVPDDLSNRLRSLELIQSSSSSDINNHQHGHGHNQTKHVSHSQIPVNIGMVVSSSLPAAKTHMDSVTSPTKEPSISGSLGRQIFKHLNQSHSHLDGLNELSEVADTGANNLSNFDPNCDVCNNKQSPTSLSSAFFEQSVSSPAQTVVKVVEEKELKNPQLILLRFILTEDGRLVKYLALFTMFGLLVAPMNFVFLSMDVVCKEKGCNFSQLAGSVLISQATVETIGFLILPFFLDRISRFVLMGLGLAVLFVRYLFYATVYYTADISPYWAVVGEWGHGLAYCIFCTIMADVALMFASESRLFINELRSLGFLSDSTKVSLEQIRNEENAIRTALRATMQALFGGFMDGLGQGSGSLLCGVLAEAYSYITLWKLLTILSMTTLLLHQAVELTRCRWSDLFKPTKDTKAYEIMQYCGHTKSTTKNSEQPELTCDQTTTTASANAPDKAKNKLCMVRLAQKPTDAAKPC